MHSSRMRTARATTGRAYHERPPFTMHASPFCHPCPPSPCTPLCHACPPSPCMPPLPHTPPFTTHAPLCHACPPLPCTPPLHHTYLPFTTHTPLCHTYPSRSNRTCPPSPEQPHTPPSPEQPCMLPLGATTHAPLQSNHARPPCGQTDTCKSITFANIVCGR